MKIQMCNSLSISFKTNKKKDSATTNLKKRRNRNQGSKKKTVSSSCSLSSRHGNKQINNVFIALREKAVELTKSEPYMTTLLEQSILHPQCTNFNNAISRAIAARLVSSCGNNPIMSEVQITEIIEQAMNSTEMEYGHTMSDAVCADILACLRRDPACETELEVVLFYKGFAALVCHRAARRHYGSTSSTTATTTCSHDRPPSKKRFVSLWLQSQASAAFGVDIHPAAEIGSGVFFDHATGLVIGETAKVGDNCTILHGVTLGGTGKEAGDRHPKIGNDVLIGAGTSILGNIQVGDSAKIGAGSVVLKPIPKGATAVGIPAKIVGQAKESKPGSTVDNALKDIVKKSTSCTKKKTVHPTTNEESRQPVMISSSSFPSSLLVPSCCTNTKNKNIHCGRGGMTGVVTKDMVQAYLLMMMNEKQNKHNIAHMLLTSNSSDKKQQPFPKKKNVFLSILDEIGLKMQQLL